MQTYLCNLTIFIFYIKTRSFSIEILTFVLIHTVSYHYWAYLGAKIN